MCTEFKHSPCDPYYLMLHIFPFLIHMIIHFQWNFLNIPLSKFAHFVQILVRQRFFFNECTEFKCSPFEPFTIRSLFLIHMLPILFSMRNGNTHTYINLEWKWLTAGFELQISGGWSDHCANCGTVAALFFINLPVNDHAMELLSGRRWRLASARPRGT